MRLRVKGPSIVLLIGLAVGSACIIEAFSDRVDKVLETKMVSKPKIYSIETPYASSNIQYDAKGRILVWCKNCKHKKGLTCGPLDRNLRMQGCR